jgi:hypothetical protein
MTKKLAIKNKKQTSLHLVHKRTILNERPPLVNEVIANPFCRLKGVMWSAQKFRMADNLGFIGWSR